MGNLEECRDLETFWNDEGKEGKKKAITRNCGVNIGCMTRSEISRDDILFSYKIVYNDIFEHINKCNKSKCVIHIHYI